MARSQNGRPANDRSLIRTYTVPDTKVRLPLRKGNDSVVLLYVAEQFNERVERLRPGWCWGYAERPIRGQSIVLSNHASGTADDLNAPEHPLGKRGTFSEAQEREIHQILREVDEVVRWGGDYRGRADEMHFEIIGSYEAVARVAAKIRAGKTKTPKPTQPKGKDVIDISVVRSYATGRKDGAHDDVRDVAALLNKLDRQDKTPLKLDGVWGPKMTAAYKAWEKHKGYEEADGIPDGAGRGIKALAKHVKSDRQVVR